jgi:hypothetical protein
MASSIRFVLIAALVAGCGSGAQHTPPPTGGSGADLTFVFPTFDLGGMQTDPMGPCGDSNPGCMDRGFGPENGAPFPLSTDMPQDPNESDNGVGRDKDGYLGLSATHAAFGYLWIANSGEFNNAGTIAKIDSKTIHEVARYAPVTCFSNKGGSKAACDMNGNGCCAADSYGQWQFRQKLAQNPGYQQVQLTQNYPSRTAVDFNGDMWVANRAFGGQSSVTKIANDKSDCIDRNKNGKIDTSLDVNGDGVINADCNENGIADDIDDVKGQACTNGKPQEYYGFDDECILLTTNTNLNDMWGRPLALGPGANDLGPSDAWAGGFNNGLFFRIDGTTGLVKAQANVGPLDPGVGPYGAVVDAQGILWTDEVTGPGLFYFDTKNPAVVGKVRTPAYDVHFYGIGIDRDQNVWMGGHPDGNAYRYTPDRSNGFAKLGDGYYTKVVNPGGVGDIGRGIAADSRSPQKYFVWMGRHPNYVMRIPASDIPLPKGMDVTVDGSKYLAIPVAGQAPAGAGVDTDQNIWGVSTTGSVATRIKVDVNGNPTLPNIANCNTTAGCPAAGSDCCPLRFGNNTDPGPYTYSDFTGFGLRNLTKPKGSYSYVQKGCDDGLGNKDTKWMAVAWDADVPLNTQIVVKARTGNTPLPDQTWGAWTTTWGTTPADLQSGGLMPNLQSDGYIQVEFDFSTMTNNASPKLKSFDILFECNNVPG